MRTGERTNNPLKLSEMTGKLKGIEAINTNPLCNPFCTGRCPLRSICYSQRMLKTFRKSSVGAFARNSHTLSNGPLEDWQVPRFKPNSLVRFNGHGELINATHINNLFLIVKANPSSSFTLWTKRPRLVQQAIRRSGKPSNLTLIYSSPRLNNRAALPAQFDKVFTVYKTEKPSAPINCGSRACQSCRLCYTKNDTVYVNETLK